MHSTEWLYACDDLGEHCIFAQLVLISRTMNLSSTDTEIKRLLLDRSIIGRRTQDMHRSSTNLFEYDFPCSLEWIVSVCYEVRLKLIHITVIDIPARCQNHSIARDLHTEPGGHSDGEIFRCL